jgi:hypothetical protein
VSGSPYPTSCSGAVAANYTFSYVNGSVTVGQRTLTITASSASVTYGDPTPLITAGYSGFAGAEGSGNLTTLPSCTTTYTQGSGVANNPYTTSCSGAVDPNYDIHYVSGSVMVLKKRLDITADNKTGVFSDPVPAYTITPSGFVLGQGLAALGGSLTFTSTVVLNGNGTIESPAGTYSILPGGYTSSNYDIRFNPGTLTVNQESATMSYTGDTLVNTGSTSTSSTAGVNLSASITEAADGYLGDKMAGRQITFTITGITGGTKSCNGTVTVPSPYAGTGTASCSISNVAIDNYTVQLSLGTNGYYIAPVEDAAVTVVNSGTGFTTGGGWVNEPNLGTKSNFGFTVKFLKNANVQGNSLYIYRKTFATSQTINGVTIPGGDYNWIIKSNAMTALNVTGVSGKCPSTTGTPCTATFTGKSTITAVNRATGTAYSLGGNNQFQVWVTDNSEPGSKAATTPDTYALRVWDSTGTYYQLGDANAQLQLAGGNIQVRP